MHTLGTLLLWQDIWGDGVLKLALPELFSFARNANISVRKALDAHQFTDNFHLPLSRQAHLQFLELTDLVQPLLHDDGKDEWTFISGSSIFSAHRVYTQLIGHKQTHPIFSWLWRSKAQMKPKVFFWLVLKDRINTRDMLRRRGMQLDSFVCELCILQRPETSVHLLLRCNFAKACGASIGVYYNSSRPVFEIFRRIKLQLGVSFFMEIIILMASSIWTSRNDWIFNNLDPNSGQLQKKVQSRVCVVIASCKNN